MKSSSPGPGGRLVRGVVTSAAALAVLVGPARSQDVGTSRDTLRMTLPPIGAVVPPRVRLSLATHEAEFRALEQRVSEDSTDARLQAATARAGTEFAAALTDVEAAREALARARGYALRAVALQPEGIEGHYWLAASSGLTADIEGGRTKIRMADAAWKESSWVLERDSLHAGAHHLQGRLHAAVMRLGRITRFLATTLLGGDALSDASWDKAEHHLTRAVALAPAEPMHHFEMGSLHYDRDRPEEAAASYRRAMELEPIRAADVRYQQRAAQRLEAMER